MNHSNTDPTPTTTTNYSNPSRAMTTISLPPISSIGFHSHGHIDYRSAPEVVQPLPPPPPRMLPPLPYPYPTPPFQHHQHYDYWNGRPIHPVIPPPPHSQIPSRVPLPATADPNLIVAPARHKTKEVKRRTKTGCLTCRKRRIKCDEGRPDCKNCIKSKRHCQGYDPVFQSQGPQNLQPQPSSQSASPSESSTSQTPRSFPHTNPPSTSSQAASVSTSSVSNTSHTTNSPRDGLDYQYPRPIEPALPNINKPYNMGNSHGQNDPPSNYPPPPPRSRHTVDEICTVAGARMPNLPPIPAGSVPNLEPIRRVYDMAFAPGLDRLLETGSTGWFHRKGFSLLIADRPKLGQMLAYLTLVSNSNDGSTSDKAVLASQEARITWALLGLCVRHDQSLSSDDQAETTKKLERRVKIIESLLTGTPLPGPLSSLSSAHRPGISRESNMDSGSGGDSSSKGTAFDNQRARRVEEFWHAIEHVTLLQHQSFSNPQALTQAIHRCRDRLDGMESRDILYSIVLMALTGNGPGSATYESTNAGNGGGNGNGASDRDLAKRFLESEAHGRATNQVYGTLASMALRAFDE